MKPIPASVKALYDLNPRLVKLGKMVNLSIVIAFVSLYIVFALPRPIAKSIQSATSDLVLASTGYTALPLEFLSSYPDRLPQIFDAAIRPSFFYVGDDRQLIIYANYKDMTDNRATGTGRTEIVTTNCTFQSTNATIASVTSGGFVQALAVGTAAINVTYTAAPGSANFSSASQGKIPVTFSVIVPVTVLRAPQP